MHTHTTDVLPEFLRLRLDEESYSVRKQETSMWASYGASSVDVRSPQLLWEILRKKVKTISRMTDVWGNLEEVYDTNQSSVRLPRPHFPAQQTERSSCAGVRQGSARPLYH